MRTIDYSSYFWQDNQIRLRAMTLEDWEVHYYNRFDTHARRQLNCEVELPPTQSEAMNMAEKFVDFKPGTGRIMFSIENHDGVYLGGINLNNIDERNGTFSIGMQIDREQRGKGYGTAAMNILLKYAFHERRLNKYYGHILEGNVASETMLKKIGCKSEGIRRQMVYTNGKYTDEILYGMTRDDYLSKDI